MELLNQVVPYFDAGLVLAILWYGLRGRDARLNSHENDLKEHGEELVRQNGHMETMAARMEGFDGDVKEVKARLGRIEQCNQEIKVNIGKLLAYHEMKDRGGSD